MVLLFPMLEIKIRNYVFGKTSNFMYIAKLHWPPGVVKA